jgi:hypothetical protein
MKRNYILEVSSDKDRSLSFRMKVETPGGETAELVSLTGDLEDFQKELALVQKEMDDLYQEAQNEVEALQKGEEASIDLDPQAVWQTMESCGTEEEMVGYFNSFGSLHRQKIADYILTRVSMFKGWGPVFAQRYNIESFLLE